MGGAEDTTSTNDTSPHATGTKRDWLALNRRERQRIRKENIRRIEEDQAARQRPGSNLPTISDAVREAKRQRKREAIARTLDRAEIKQPDNRSLLQEILLAAHGHQIDRNTAEIALEQITAMVRHVESFDLTVAAPPDSITLREFDVLAPVRILLNAIGDALANNMANFLALLPDRDNPAAGSPPSTTAANIRACATVGLEVLTMGKAKRGGISKEKAKQLVCDAFRAVGLDFTPATLIEWSKRINRGADPAARTEFDVLIAPVRKAAATYWETEERKAQLKRLAEIAGRILET
jgi:hypothetical protein